MRIAFALKYVCAKFSHFTVPGRYEYSTAFTTYLYMYIYIYICSLLMVMCHDVGHFFPRSMTICVITKIIY